MAKSKTSTTSKEKVTGLLYVILLFVVTSSLCAYILFFYNSDYQFISGKKTALVDLERVNTFESAQSEYLEKIKEIDNNANRINTSLNATYEKRELTYKIGELRKISNDNKYDSRFKIFDQAAYFYELKIFDKERLSASLKNIDKFTEELDKCRAGVETLKNN